MPEPVRTCLGCRQRANQGMLLRVVAADGSVEVDVRRIRPGRGAYVHADAGCVERAVKRRTFGRALRAPVDSGSAGHVLAAHLAATASA